MRIDVYYHNPVLEGKVDAIIVQLNRMEAKQMAVGDDILAKITEEDTLLDSCLALLQGLIDAGTIPPGTIDAIKAKVQGSEDKLNAAIAANTHL